MKTANALLILFLSIAQSFAYTPKYDKFGSGENTFYIEFVTIGNPKNRADTTGIPNPAGSVPYSFRICTYEIDRYAMIKANAAGVLGITFGGGLTTEPATSVSWYEAARFVNFLNTSTGHMPAYNFDTSGNFQLWQAGNSGYNPTNPFRNALASYFLPSMDEWYKAAYFDPVKNVYYDFPTGSDTTPDGTDYLFDFTYDAVFVDGGPIIGVLKEAGDVGISSPYGTYGQGGNVAEWLETTLDQLNDVPSSPRYLRGGTYLNYALEMTSSIARIIEPNFEHGRIGFRVASTYIPEPSTALLACASLLCLARVRP